MNRVTVVDNAFTNIGAEGRAALMLFTHALSNVFVARNTFRHAAGVGTDRGSAITMDYGNRQARAIEWRDNVIDAGAYGPIYSGVCCGTVSIQALAGDAWRFANNALVGGGSLASRMPTGNTFLATPPTTGGVNQAELQRRTAGVVVQP